MSDFSNLEGLLATAKQLQMEMARVKDELGRKSVSAETGGGLVKCAVDGKGELTALEVDPSLLSADSRKMLEDLVVGAVNLALERSRQMAQEEMAKVAGGLPLPPGLFGG